MSNTSVRVASSADAVCADAPRAVTCLPRWQRCPIPGQSWPGAVRP